MQPFLKLGMEGSGLHERGPEKLELYYKVCSAYASGGNKIVWWEHLYDVYEAWAVNGKFNVTIERMTESFFAVCVRAQEGSKILFSTLCSDIWEAKIVGDALFCLALGAKTEFVEVILGWEEAYARHLRSLWMASIQHPITTTPFSTMPGPSFLKGLLSALETEEVSYSTSPNTIVNAWTDASYDTTTY